MLLHQGDLRSLKLGSSKPEDWLGPSDPFIPVRVPEGTESRGNQEGGRWKRADKGFGPLAVAP